MGQRLVVTIQSHNEDVAKIYYHWSAYSRSALEEVKSLLDCILEHDDADEKSLQLRLIRYCEQAGGGIRGAQSEFDYIQQMFPGKKFKNEGYSRNNGLIAISDHGMTDLQSWSEGDVCINLDNDMIHNTVYYIYDDMKAYNDEHREWDEDYEDLTLDDIPELGCDLCDIEFGEIDEVLNALNNLGGYVCRHGDTIIGLIA